MSGLTDERLAEIEARVQRNRDAREWFVPQPIEIDVDDLLAEVKRLRDGIDNFHDAHWKWIRLQDARWDAAYWEYMALHKRRVWWLGWDWRIYLGGDEYNRRTIVVGPVCIALWHDSEARERIAVCEDIMDASWSARCGQ